MDSKLDQEPKPFKCRPGGSGISKSILFVLALLSAWTLFVTAFNTPTALVATPFTSDSPNQVQVPTTSLPDGSMNNDTRKPTSIPATQIIDDGDFVSACVLTKDDLPIIAEWIAYHYHTLKLRHIIVATDPTSKESPSHILQRFRKHLPDLRIEEWNDMHYMPQQFLDLPSVHDTFDESHVVPNFVPPRFQNASTSPWHFGNESTQQLLYETKIVNRHRYRQRVFLHKCYSHIYNQNHQQRAHTTSNSIWALHIDTDEYIVLNPFVRQQPGRLSKIPTLPTQHLTPNCVYDLLESMFRYYPKRIQRSCLSMPTILYGSVEREHALYSNQSSDTGAKEKAGIRRRFSTSTGNSTATNAMLETLRWKYHAAWEDPMNGFDKTLIDLAAVPVTDRLLQGPYAYNPHQPSEKLCPKLKTNPEISATRKYPLTINHYLGTWERFASRGDTRKSWTMYQRKANLSSIQDDGSWMDSWFGLFADEHGVQAVEELLQIHMVK